MLKAISDIDAFSPGFKPARDMIWWHVKEMVFPRKHVGQPPWPFLANSIVTSSQVVKVPHGVS